MPADICICKLIYIEMPVYVNIYMHMYRIYIYPLDVSLLIHDMIQELA